MSSPFRMLLVDGTPEVLRALVRVLGKRPGLTVQTTSTAVEALALLATEDFDAIVSGRWLRGMNGIELLDEVRRLRPGIIRLMLSAEASDAASWRVVQQYWHKPWSNTGLVDAIDRLIRVRQVLRDPQWRSEAGDVQRLPSPPRTLIRLNEILDNPGSAIGEVNSIVEGDPAIAARVMQLANSAFFGMSTPASSINLATVRLGLDTLRAVAAADALFAALSPPTDLLDITEVQRASQSSAAAIQRLCPEREARSFGFAAGLLSRVGLLLLASRLPETYRDAKRQAKAGGSVADVLRADLGIDDGELAGYLLGIWGLPPAVVEAISAQLNTTEPLQRPLDVPSALRVVRALGDDTGETPAWLLAASSAKERDEWRRAVDPGAEP